MDDDALEDRWKAFREVRQDPNSRNIVGDIWKAAEAAGVMPGTLRVWMSRGKLKPLFGEPGREVFHIPTVIAVAKAGRAKNIPRNPAANARGPHARRAA